MFLLLTGLPALRRPRRNAFDLNFMRVTVGKERPETMSVMVRDTEDSFCITASPKYLMKADQGTWGVRGTGFKFSSATQAT